MHDDFSKTEKMKRLMDKDQKAHSLVCHHSQVNKVEKQKKKGKKKRREIIRVERFESLTSF